MHSVGEVFQLILAIGFSIAAVRLHWTARNGRSNIRLFRIVGSVLSALWAVFYYAAAFTDTPASAMAPAARSLNYLVLMMFLLWGFLFHEERWEEDAKQRLDEAMRDD